MTFEMVVNGDGGVSANINQRLVRRFKHYKRFIVWSVAGYPMGSDCLTLVPNLLLWLES